MSLQTHFIPYYDANPYQSLLESALDKLGIPVIRHSGPHELGHLASDRIIHLHWLKPAPSNPLALLRWLNYARRTIVAMRRAPTVLTAHNLLPHESARPVLDRMFARAVVRRANRIICHGETAADEVAAMFGIERRSPLFRIIPHGHYINSYPNTIDKPSARESLGIPNSELVFLFVGMIRAYKGTEDLIRSFRAACPPQSRLLIAGRPFDNKTDESVRRAIGDAQTITYRPGFVPDSEMQIYLNAADVVVFPYKKGLTSGALILALSFARAVIAPRLPGIVETAGETAGFFYSPHADGDLARALAEAQVRRGELDSIGQANLLRARALDWDDIGRATKICYEEARASFILGT